ncbi:MAG: hypothetical protein JWM33_1848 [Caulobacteraceae bacterium]|nr:hypothetical protein [Caulobacteraceae bacterium]
MTRLRLLLLTLLLALTAVSPAMAGPVWWRVSDGSSVLWILGVPDYTLTQFDWDETSLKYRLGKAGRLYDPTIGGIFQMPAGSQVSAGFAPEQLARSTNPDVPTQYLGPWAPNRAAFDTPADLLARVRAAADKRSVFAFERLRNNETYLIAQWLDQTNWPKGATGNAVAWRAFQLSQTLRLPIVQVAIPELWPAQRPSQAVQEACLRMVLEESESGLMPRLRSEGLAAWAKGDLDGALKRGSDLRPCLFGQQASTDAVATYQRIAHLYVTAADGAFGKPGQQSVALVAFDPLMVDEGVLAHYRQLGYQISLSDGMGE